MSFPVKNGSQLSASTVVTCLLIVCVAIAYNSLRNELTEINERLQMLEQEPSVESASMRRFLIDSIEGLECDMEDVRARMQTIESRRR